MSFGSYFKRQIELWGEETQKLLSSKRVLIVGAGGLGSSLALALGSSGIGKIELIDFDSVAYCNIHRQIAFKLEDEGRNKAKVVANLLLKRCPFVEVNSYDVSFKEFIESSSSSFDIILDATDNFQTRKAIDKWAKSIKTPWIYASVEAFLGQVCFFEDSSFEVFVTNSHTPKGVTPPMVMQIASFSANLALRYLANLPILKDTLYYFYYDEVGEFHTKKFSLPKEGT